jgi:hypothetical protein
MTARQWCLRILVESRPNGEHVRSQLLIAPQLFLHLVHAVENGRVVSPSEPLPDLHQGKSQLFAQEIHRDLARQDDLATSARANEFRQGNPEVLADGVQYEFWRQLLAHCSCVPFPECLDSEREGDRLVRQLGQRNDPIERPFQLPDIALDPPSHELHDVRRHLDPKLAPLLDQDRLACLEIRWLDVREKPALEAGPQAIR